MPPRPPSTAVGQYLEVGDNAVLNNLPGATFDFQADVSLRTNY